MCINILNYKSYTNSCCNAVRMVSSFSTGKSTTVRKASFVGPASSSPATGYVKFNRLSFKKIHKNFHMHGYWYTYFVHILSFCKIKSKCVFLNSFSFTFSFALHTAFFNMWTGQDQEIFKFKCIILFGISKANKCLQQSINGLSSYFAHNCLTHKWHYLFAGFCHFITVEKNNTKELGIYQIIKACTREVL